MSLRLALAAIAAFIAIGLFGVIHIQTERLRAAEHLLDETRTALFTERDRHARTLTTLAAERAAAERRQDILAASREAIIAAPAADDGPVAPVLANALRAADQIGGHHE